MRYAARSDVGLMRAKNDDSAYAGRHLAVVADGMGGHAGGNVASASTVLDLIHLDHDDYDGDAGTVLADEIQTANSILSQLVHVDPLLAGMGTTVTALLLSEGELHFAHIGDSRAYRLRDGKFEQLSVDHTFVQRLVDEGRLRPEEAETHPHKNVLMRVLGDVDASPELDLSTVDIREGDRWLLCSDGLNYVPHHMVEAVIRGTASVARAADQLVELTLAAGAPDNVTVIVLDLVPDDDGGATAVVPPAAAEAAAPADAAGEPSKQEDEDGKTPADPPSTGLTTSTVLLAPPAADDTRTDPNLGAHLTAEVLRLELESRPHELVGAAALALETGKVPNIAGRAVARRAASILTHRQEREDIELPQDAVTQGRRRRHWFRWVVAGLLVAIVVLGVWFGYAWTQTRYYVGEADGRVAIYNGVSQQLGPIKLSTVHSITDLQVSSLPPFSQQRVHETIAANDLSDAEQIVKSLTLDLNFDERGCPGPSGSPTARPSASGGATATPTARPTPSPSGSPANACGGAG
ncbi:MULTISPECIES: PP2C family serine/threonine-protein phosphatase [Arthrobacter]|uniref:PP2C family serine/threonine-protein phosphatase n=2 Tax=Arthrobacter TaxID=1663 RepID=A0ABU9KJT7_9MICC|nr:PP2C family serine/threonine-protein phosphatase [Arthrobacter sp. YJM1]MDP5226931.1 protein phosphatase 2C domain-containing protein [Arthrobacter sp. YJM1]